MAEEALAELSSVTTAENPDPDIIELRLHVLMQAKRWSEALVATKDLLRVRPDAPPAYIHGAFALHELGRTAEARDLLLKGPEELRKDPTYHYNVGCYEAVLGNREAALDSLRQSFALDAAYLDFARHDPDLTLIRKELEA